MAGNYPGPMMKAARMALESGNARHILIWVPEGSENTLKNLLEKACCERYSQKSKAADWYFETVQRLHRSGMQSNYSGIEDVIFGEIPVIRKADEAIETGNFEQLSGLVPVMDISELRQRFDTIREMRNYPDLSAGRTFVSAYLEFMLYLYKLSGTQKEYEDNKSNKNMV
jgi:hypothetical protein